MRQRTIQAKLPVDCRSTTKGLAVTMVMLGLLVCISAVTTFGQRTRIDTGTTPPPKTITTGRAAPKYRIRKTTPRPETSRAVVSEDTAKFLKLGDQFTEAHKWHAAVAANSVALKLSPGNSDASGALAISKYNLGLYYVYMGNMQNAMTEYEELRKLDSNMAQDLLADIKSSGH
jgi:hypothetical protein